MNIYVGAKFSSFEEFEKKCEKYQDTVFANYYRDSSSLLKEDGDLITVEVAERLKYKRLVYLCKMSGKRKEKETYVRKTSTYKKQCASKLTVLLKKADDEYFLQVQSFTPHHNHDLSEKLYRAMPNQRRKVLEGAKPFLDRVMSTKPDYKLLQFDLSNESGGKGVVKRRDLYNYNAKIKNSLGKTEMEEIVNELLSLDGACVKVVHDTGKALQGIFFQDGRMQSIFKAFPEILLFDGTYRLNNRRMPLVTLLAIDGNGESQIVGLFLVVSENLEIFTTMFREFKKENENWDKIEVVLTDKAMVNLSVVANELPGAAHQLCIFHVKQNFNREITTVKRQITSDEKKACLDIVNKMLYSGNQTEYDELYDQLSALNCNGEFLYYFYRH